MVSLNDVLVTRLKRIKIEKFRSVTPGTELHFRDTTNILLGKNGAGKTTLLKLIASLLRWDFSDIRQDELLIEYEFEVRAPKEAGVTIIKVRLQNEIEETGGLPEQIRDVLPYAASLLQHQGNLSVNIKSTTRVNDVEKSFFLSIVGTKVKAWDTDGSAPVEFSTDSRPLDGWVILNILSLSQLRTIVGHSVFSYSAMGFLLAYKLNRFDESLGYLNLITTNQYFVDRAANRDDVDVSPVALPFQDPFAKVLKAKLLAEPGGDVVRTTIRQGTSEPLSRAIELLGFEEIGVRIERVEHTPGEASRTRFLGPRFDFRKKDGTIISHDALSYGQKRLFSFYYYLENASDFVVADELVNGMHHEWLEACLGDLENRQAFLTSQNPLLLDYLSFESAEEAQSSFILCGARFVDGRERLDWQNMPDRDANEFFRAYEVGIQHVSDILRTGGLW